MREGGILITEERKWKSANNCWQGYQPVQQPVVVCQVVGRNSTQKSLDICLTVPRRRPGIEQIVDVFVNKIHINSVDVACDEVIVRGCFEVKALYVACLPSQPVHAIEARNVRFTASVDVRGARRWMDAEASVHVEFVDYDCDSNTRAQWHKSYHNDDYDDCDDQYDDDDCKPCYKSDTCKPYCKQDTCKPYDKPDDCKPCCEPDSCKPYDKPDECRPCCKPDSCKPQHEPDHCRPCCKPDTCRPNCKPCKPPRRCARKCNVSVVLRINAKVMTSREVVFQPQATLPYKPKG